MGMVEYRLRMEAFELQQVLTSQHIAEQAWANQTVQATTGERHPKPKYRKFDQFFDYQEHVDMVRSAYEPDYKARSKKIKKQNRAEILLARSREFHRLKKAGKIIPLAERKGER
ncbi:hypothetical protein [Limosilactobacillus mucosae]|uniref:hypothetical protein n=1 Tax=Limosilactobacillus mucosae TaxID=97478 RepID=UPI0022E9095A|nr:hypothetical protein [Limosilactobacillus mucosae]